VEATKAWTVPEKYRESARVAMGGTDLVPFTSDAASGPVWLAAFDDNKADDIAWLIASHKAGTVPRAIVLSQNSLETRWCQALLRACSAFCLTDHRIKFEDTGGKARGGNTRGQLFAYLGDDADRFVAEFERYGFCWNGGAIEQLRG